MMQDVDEVETEFHRAMAPDTIEEAFFNFASLNSRQFLATIKETYALACLPEPDTLAIQVLLRTRARVKRDIMKRDKPGLQQPKRSTWSSTCRRWGRLK